MRRVHGIPRVSSSLRVRPRVLLRVLLQNDTAGNGPQAQEEKEIRNGAFQVRAGRRGSEGGHKMPNLPEGNRNMQNPSSQIWTVHGK